MKKIYAFFASALMSVSVFAAKDVVPSDVVLANYYDQGNVCVCIYVPGDMACYDIVLTGSFNGWSSTPSNCAMFEPIEGYDGWYVTSFEPEAEPDMEKGIQAKPIMLDYAGRFNWDYQIGAATAIRGGVQVVQGGFEGEIDLITYGVDVPNVFTVDTWKNNPCTKIYHNYTITVISDGCNNLAVPFIVGGMTGWIFQQMQLDQAKSIENNAPTYTISFQAAEGTTYQILSGLMDGTGQIIETPQWNDMDFMQKLVGDQWVRIPGENGDNQMTYENANIVWDLRNSTLRWARCAPQLYSLNVTCDNTKGRVRGSGQYNYGTQVTFSAIPNNGYHFTQWSDSVTDNPRTIILTQDTTFIAEFAINEYKISTNSSNLVWGTTYGDTTAHYLDQIEISATANYGYHFVRWSDGYTNNPRIISVTASNTYTAIFEQNTYYITKYAENGYISGYSSAGYLDDVVLTAIPNYGYHFVRWNDGVTENPRSFIITQDTTFTAEFVIDRTGACGDNNALTWSYNATEKTLTITGSGVLSSNYTYGAEAPRYMEKLIIAEGVTAIGANAFSNMSSLAMLQLPASLKTIGDKAFENCIDLISIYNYRERPCLVSTTAFDGVNKFDCTLYVLAGSVDMYKSTGSNWKDFYYILPIGTTEVTEPVTEVITEPTESTVILTWPTNDDAATYTIEITKDGVLFCTLTFNSNGQLIGIAFAPSRNGTHHAPTAIMTVNGLQFTVTGLDSNTQYNYSVTAKNESDEPIATYSGIFTTSGEGTATGVDQINSSSFQGEAHKILLNGQIFILRGEKTYTLTGQEVKQTSFIPPDVIRPLTLPLVRDFIPFIPLGVTRQAVFLSLYVHFRAIESPAIKICLIWLIREFLFQ